MGGVEVVAMCDEANRGTGLDAWLAAQGRLGAARRVRLEACVAEAEAALEAELAWVACGPAGPGMFESAQASLAHAREQLARWGTT